MNPIRFAAIGLNHGHIYGQVETLLQAGAELVSFHAVEPELAEPFSQKYPQAKRARSIREVLEDESIDLIASAAIPCERAGVGVGAMRHGKDFFSDKPAATTLKQLNRLREVQAATGRIFSVFYSERLGNKASQRAGELIRDGAIGTVIQVIGFGPHRANLPIRPAWFFERRKYGGILCDIGSHQCEQYLFFAGEEEVEVASSQVANWAHPEYSGLEDFGDATLRGQHSTGYFRVDWFTPDGLNSWGDGRCFIVGTNGTIELRKNCDLTGRDGGNHLFLVDGQGTRYINCDDVELTFGRRLLDDIRNRAETAMSQEHCFRATELALHAQEQAMRLGHLQSRGE